MINGLLDIDGIIGANTLQGTIFAGGSHGFLSLYLRGLPDDLCDVNELTVQIGPSTAPTFFVSCSDGAGQRQINAFVPTDVPLGTAPVQLMWRNSVVSSPYFVRVIESPPAAPRILVVTDGHEVGRHNAIYCGWAKIWITDLLAIDLFRATIGGIPMRELDFFCEDIRARRYQINIRVPDELSEV